jgi:hypothetical protein
MTRFEIRAEGLTILEDADDEMDAVEKAVEQGVLSEGDAGSVAEYDGRPVGADGTDPEELTDLPGGPHGV